MKYGIRLPVGGPFSTREAFTKMATEAERLGYDAVMTTDNLLWGPGDRYHFYVGSKEAQDQYGGPSRLLGAIPSVAYAAALTERVRIIPDALCIAWRNVVILAREALTLYELSGGRFVLGVCLGVGLRSGDYAVTGTPWHERGRIASEKLQVLRMLIDRGGPISFEGNYVKLQNVELFPQPAGMPLWYAGTSDAALKRAARYADGWMPSAIPDYFKRKIPELFREAERVGRGNVSFDFATTFYITVAPTDQEAWDIARATLEVSSKRDYIYGDPSAKGASRAMVGSPETVASIIREYEAAGVTWLHLGFIGHSVESILEQMELFAREVMPQAT